MYVREREGVCSKINKEIYVHVGYYCGTFMDLI